MSVRGARTMEILTLCIMLLTMYCLLEEPWH